LAYTYDPTMKSNRRWPTGHTSPNNLTVHSPRTYGSSDFGTIFTACIKSPDVHWPFSRPSDKPIRFSTSMSSWISKVRSKLNKYSDLNSTKHVK